MSELGPLDSGFMELEDIDQHVNLGIGAVAILRGSPGSRAEFTDRMAERIGANPRLRQRLRRAPFDLSAPRWVDDPHFDMGHHLRWAALPQPCDETTLWEMVATVMTERLDRDHPLWRCTVVEHLADDRWALIVTAHHSMVDGVSGISLFQRFCDPTPDSPTPKRDEPDDDADRGRDWRALLADGLRLPVQAPAALLRTVRAAVPLAWNAIVPESGSSLTGPIGRQRRYTVARVSLDQVKRIGAVFDATVNDVALAAVTAAFRAMLLARDEEPDTETVRILAPVSVRTTDADGVLDNRVSAMLPQLPTELDDPLDQLRTVHQRLNKHKASGEAGAANSILSLAKWVPFAPLAWAVRTALRFPQHSIAGLATNVPGPARTLRLHGHEVLEMFPYAPIAMRLRTAIAILSYRDHLGFGITGDYDTTPDLDLLADTITTTVDRLLDSCPQS
ncbi:wax ester/triacylglycerol synthase family O-acyltransferase [Nocardia bhagyanarayanae]|uniref:Diacylglycerol O-acyltransferase n=1 Tax=Nocardia bhagyanarayanae TaxID=1215925 RepID=A0A543FF80_9NOCA|nr:wax ester/triacylglycerol synthase family O-acyltransferase [Nocardia bhagyanarayanae]TQM32422.1 diacylglycerol O-acyltransferase [Nocardia bhagyanarayanae]